MEAVSPSGAASLRFRAILFDLDGTLVDSAPDIRAAVNALLARRNLGPLSMPEVKSMIGHGIKKLVERAYAACGQPLAGDALEREFEAMMTIYGEHLTVLATLMPGAREAVQACRDAGMLLGLVTNKPQRFTEAILAHFGFGDDFDVIIGGDAGFAKKPEPDMLLAALDRLGVGPGEALMVGDSAADVQAARAAGISVTIIEGGYTIAPAGSLGADCILPGLVGLPAMLEPAPAK